MPRRRPLEQSTLAERRLAALFARVWDLARAAAEKVLDKGRGAIRLAIEQVLRGSSIRAEVRAVARTVENSFRRQLKKVLSDPLPKDIKALTDVVKDWISETMASLRELLVGGRRDAAFADAWPSLLDLAVKAGSGAETVAERARALGRSAAKAARRVRSAAKARALNIGGQANRVFQVAVGVERYEWRTQRDWKVRPIHADLNGTIQRWDDPPVISKDGRRGHPGDDYNCRCIAIPHG